jgi:hypothetical protein
MQVLARTRTCLTVPHMNVNACVQMRHNDSDLPVIFSGYCREPFLYVTLRILTQVHSLSLVRIVRSAVKSISCIRHPLC